MPRPLFILLLFLIGGQVAATLIDLPSAVLFTTLAGIVLAQGAMLLRKPGAGEPVISRGVLLLAAFAVIGAIGQQRIERRDKREGSILKSFAGRPWTHFKGVVTGLPEAREDALLVTLSRVIVTPSVGLAPIALPGRVRLTLRDDALASLGPTPPQPGDTIEAQGVMRPPDAARNPNAFDFKAYLRSNGYTAAVSIGTASTIEILPAQRLSLLQRAQRRAGALHARTLALFEKHVSKANAPILRGVLFGDAVALDARTRELYVRTGLTHLFSVSGFHTGLICGVVFCLLRMFGVSFRLTWIATAVLVWAFAGFVGFRPPVVRAALMISILALGNATGREHDPINTLSFAGLAVLIGDPLSLWRVDVQLSYLSVFSILALQPVLFTIFVVRVEPDNPRKRFATEMWNRFLGMPLATAVAAQLGLMPLLAVYYGEISLVAPISNLFVLLLAVAGTVCGFLMFVFGHAIEPLAIAAGTLCDLFFNAFQYCVAHLGRWKFASAQSGIPPWWAVAAYYAALFGGTYMLASHAPGERERARSHFFLHAAALIAWVVWMPAFAPSAHGLSVRFLDVGQGDAAYIEFPDGKNMLIDGGPSIGGDRGRSAAREYLRSRGVHRLSAIVATHGDADHIGGLVAVLESMPVRMVALGTSTADTNVYREFNAAIRENGARVETVTRGDTLLTEAGISIAVFNPPANGGALPRNDQSVVLRMDYGETSFLFTGDAEAQAEGSMLAAGLDLDTDFLKAAHHGSRSSSIPAFLTRNTPEGVIVSVGRNNRYGHPHPDVLQRLTETGAQIFRTDMQGSVLVETDGHTARVETMLGE